MTSRPVSLCVVLLLVSWLGACSSGGQPPTPNPSRAPGVARLQLDTVVVEPGAPTPMHCTASDPDGDAVTYVFDWGGTTSLVTSPEVPSGTTSGVVATFEREGTFQVRCRAVDAHGTAGEWSAAVALTVRDASPAGTWELRVRVVGKGRVTSTPVGIDCSEACDARFATGTRMTVEAEPAEGWRLLEMKPCQGAARSCEVVIDGDRFVTALFAPETDATLSWQRSGARLPGSPQWSPDGTRLTALEGTSSGGPLRIWDARSGAVTRMIFAPADARFVGLAWKPEGNTLAAGLSTGRVVLLDAVTGATLRTWAVQGGAVEALAWSPDGARLATATNASKEVHVWDAATGEREGAPLTAVDRVRALTWSPDGSRLAMEAGRWGGAFSQWVEFHGVGTRTLEELLEIPGGFAWSPDGTRFAVGFEGEVRVYLTAGHLLESTYKGDWSRATLVDWSANGRWLAVGDPMRKLFVLDAATGAVLVDASQTPPTGTATGYDALSFHPTEPRFAVVDDLPTSVLDVFTLELDKATVVRSELLAHDLSVENVAWSPTGAMLASSGGEGKVQLWGPGGEWLRTLTRPGGKRVRALAWSADGTRLASGGDDGLVHLWNAADGTLAQLPITQSPATLAIDHVGLSPDGTLLATAASSPGLPTERGVIRVFRVGTGAEVFRFPEGERRVLSLQWTPQGQLVATFVDVGWSIWNPTTREVSTVPAHGADLFRAAALSPDGTRLVLGNNVGLFVREVATGSLVMSATTSVWPLSLTWSPDGRRFVGGTLAGQVLVWDTARFESPAEVIGFHERGVAAVSWRSAEDLIATGGGDVAVRVWRFAP
ncbi:WD40 repeat domain-containing protein [Myxococcus sp. XM-1-1-1]|uniref:WD40 repeat domain-containing protein n=1 Tax=Myxococcus sp. XM-1-1-1 TaxID=2874602 RepID=UPI001CBD900E|nr:WD40 repeat domain-containing protein [Myxococcus sp. XM-1-1-1]MBZ4409448.1 WD40 repeat domain-containing protein [Myxococcus sp. XM-1-1-1]